jgi:general secretion pathway protein A
MDYESYYGLSKEPFGTIPDAQFYYDGPEHSNASLRLMHVATRMRGLGTLVGCVGTGKTILSRRILNLLHESGDFEAGLLVLTHSDFSPIWLLQRIGSLVGLKDLSSDKTRLLSGLTARLIEIHHEGKKAVAIIDEANKLQKYDVIEELRGLLNLELPDTRLITFILSGPPEMDHHLQLNESLYQRIACRVTLEPLSSHSVKGYIRHRLNVAGREDDLFSESAIDLINIYSGGHPRIINTICDLALLETFLAKDQLVDTPTVKNVANTLGLIKEHEDESEQAGEEKQKNDTMSDDEALLNA